MAGGLYYNLEASATIPRACGCVGASASERARPVRGIKAEPQYIKGFSYHNTGNRVAVLLYRFFYPQEVLPYFNDFSPIRASYGATIYGHVVVLTEHHAVFITLVFVVATIVAFLITHS